MWRSDVVEATIERSAPMGRHPVEYVALRGDSALTPRKVDARIARGRRNTHTIQVRAALERGSRFPPGDMPPASNAHTLLQLLSPVQR